MPPTDRREFFGPERALAFSDGVFAVAITLLVLDLRLPEIERSDAALLTALLAMEQKLLIFAFTFIIVGMSWLGHHRKFSYIRRVDGGLLWLNLLYLLALCLVPFGSSVLNAHGDSGLGFAVYAIVMMLLLLLSTVVSVYCLRPPFLVEAGLPPGVREDLILPQLINGVIFLLAAGLAIGGWISAAHWCPLLIIAVSAYFGTRAKRFTTRNH